MESPAAEIAGRLMESQVRSGSPAGQARSGRVMACAGTVWVGTGQVGRLQLGWLEQVRAEQGERFCPDKMKQLISSLSCLSGLLCGQPVP